MRGATTSTPFFASTRAVARLCGAEGHLLDAAGEEPHRGPLGALRPASPRAAARDPPAAAASGSSGSHAGQRPGQEPEEARGAHQALEPAHLVEAKARRPRARAAAGAAAAARSSPTGRGGAAGRRGAGARCRRARPRSAARRARRTGTPSRRRGSRGRGRGARRCESVRPMRPSARDLMRKMRPRGESISVPSSGEGRAVGEAEAAVHAAVDALDALAVEGQRTRRRVGASRWRAPWRLDAAHEAPGVQDARGIQLGLEPLHDPMRGRRADPTPARAPSPRAAPTPAARGRPQPAPARASRPGGRHRYSRRRRRCRRPGSAVTMPTPACAVNAPRSPCRRATSPPSIDELRHLAWAARPTSSPRSFSGTRAGAARRRPARRVALVAVEHARLHAGAVGEDAGQLGALPRDLLGDAVEAHRGARRRRARRARARAARPRRRGRSRTGSGRRP